MRISADTLSLRELLNLVENGVAYWRRRLESAEGVARDQAAEAIRELSRILNSLAEQIAIGRETVRITGRLPAMRASVRPCGVCGRGNRAAAKYCIACGTSLAAGATGAPRTPPRLNLAVVARSDRGMVRQVNEDTCYSGEFSTADGTIGTLLLVADGMGGHAAGDVASQWASETIKQALRAALEHGVPANDEDWHALLNRTVQQANQRIYAAAHKAGPQQGMGTTLTIALLTERRAHIAHVGDSRAYLINPAGVNGDANPLMQLTHDHSIVARLVDIGQLTPEEARVHPQRNMIYRSLGADPTIEVDLRSQSLAVGDVIVLCSDGLTNHVEDAELSHMVETETDPARLAEQLIALANRRGGRDNISVVIARVAGETTTPQG
ncbi:MAG: Stp1/IreP family PP2C-type Ser/Thr phosphatase [Oscillochloris sp.]|nr:Stp1/IreP family PP2C-type Ser/Thr phosphatase [Oscillochloris sp.]